MPLKKLKEANEKRKEAEKEYQKVFEETKKELAEVGLTLMEEEKDSELKSLKIKSYPIPITINWDFPKVTHIYPYLTYPPYTISTNTSTLNFENKRS